MNAKILLWSAGLIPAGFYCLLMSSPSFGQVTAPQPKPAQPSQTVPGPPARVSSPAATPIQRSLLQQVQDAFTNIAKNAEPFVVNIKASHQLGADAGLDQPIPNASPKTPRIPGAPVVPQSPSPFPRQEQATGSGLIVRGDGYILTNDHVVEGSQFVTVTLSDGREYRGRVTADFRSDLALVKIDPGTTTLTVAKFADAQNVQPGQWAIAIGSPFDLQNTLTVGVVSALHRHQVIGEDPANVRYYPDLIQTDAAINPGNSGGPLLNIDGEVIGVNVAIESPVEGSSGVGFAIPADTALYISSQLIKNGCVVRGYLGLAPEDLTPAREQLYGVNTGAWVVQVDRDSPAGKAGVHATDIVTSFDGTPIANELTLRNAISQTQPGKAVTLGLVRDGKPLTVDVTVASAPPSQSDAAAKQPQPTKIGVTYRALAPSDREELSLSPGVNGLIITAVAPNSPADQAGLMQNDVVEQINRQPLSSAAQLTEALNAIPVGGDSTLVIERSTNGKVQEIAVDLKP